MTILLTSASPDFFRVFPGGYLAARRAGMALRLETCEDGWALVASDGEVERARQMLGLAGPGLPKRSPEGPDRAFAALLLLQHGLSLEEIAAVLPNYASNSREGVSLKSAEIILRSAMRTLLSSVLLERRPAGLPDELWPPEAVRYQIRGARSGRTWRSQLRRLKDWVLEGAEEL